MKKIIIGIFAHPDDEAFGPCGTLLLESKAGNDLHLITLTGGENGTNPGGENDLGSVRLDEWHKAGQLLGAQSMHHLGYVDGMLGNLAMIEITSKLEVLIANIIKDAPTDSQIEFISLDLGGYTGHIDHIVAARAAALTFYRLKANDQRFTRVRLACQPRKRFPISNIDWIYMDAGRTESEISETVDAREHYEQIDEIMRCHQSQVADYNMIKKLGDQVAINYFIDLT